MKREQSAVTEESELPWTRALGIWGFATLLKGFWQIAFLQNSTLSKALNTAPSTTWSSWRETPKSNIPKKKKPQKKPTPAGYNGWTNQNLTLIKATLNQLGSMWGSNCTILSVMPV